ncbi:MAG: hypothetical protein GYA24_10400 [Candidatus Lokiarchaeota archaeon]|nr:hypothetical protein [Candidatus Lokiarchaeota archaeon]
MYGGFTSFVTNEMPRLDAVPGALASEGLYSTRANVEAGVERSSTCDRVHVSCHG